MITATLAWQTVKMILYCRVLVFQLLVLCCTYISHIGGQGGAFLSLSGRIILNDSYVDVNKIGDRPGESALLCHTDLHKCCSANQTANGTGIGYWFFLNYDLVKYNSVSMVSTNASFFHWDRGRSVVRLWRHGTPTESGLFCCHVPDSSNTTVIVCANVVNITITVQPMSYQQVILRDTAVLQVVAQISVEDQTLIEYTWQRNNQTIQNSNRIRGTRTATLTIRDFRSGQQGSYRCMLNNIILSDEAVLTLGVYLLVNGRTFSNNTYINADEETDISISCITNNTDCCRNSQEGGHWFSPSGELISSSTPPLTVSRGSQMLGLFIRSLDVAERGRFICKIPNANYIEEAIHIHVLSKPTFIRHPPSLVVVYVSNNVTLSVQGFGGTLTYQWFKNDLQITESARYKGATTSKLTIVDVHWGDEGLYSCSVVNDLGNVTSGVSLLSVVNRPKVGMQYSLTCSAAGSGKLHPSIPYRWYKDGMELPNKTSSELVFDMLSICDAGNYSCRTSFAESTLHKFELSFSSLQFQLQLMVVKECSQWIPGKLEKFTKLLLETMEEQCQCGLTEAHITEEELMCSQEMGTGVIFSARLSQTMQASITDLINLLRQWNMERILMPVEHSGTDSEMLTETVVEGLLTPSCFRTVDSTTATSVVASRMLSLSEVIVWIVIAFLICAVVVVFILSAAVFALKRQLNKASCKSREPSQTDSDLHTSANVCYHYIENPGTSESQMGGGESVTSHTLQIYEEIDRSNDDVYCL